ncbi:raffinose/stachyose/melibiose transport system substrate-binding protein [Paenibacillus phyllosphaerae]|uniref:Raffinose/stachyose/melibiose transport system substrate-binding protein n=1 Tax=Paenibacillus phyllosphaerae TaxID=274593 RepID=A0A7W5AYV9_9BACL|nr:extracellular solute-binding protein [Paenibacillus phyllosphaerae]MBB3111292.1 raffinose/stachyose/melibiose transport system substrate-binding protein [Paenibacillus phyllosphaerae]
MRRGRFKSAGVLLLAISLSVLLSSCNRAAMPDNGTQENQTTILYLSSNKENEGSAKIISELSREYEALHPNVKFKFENLPERDLNQRVQLLAASNDLPVAFSYQSGKPLQDLIQSDAVLDVEKAFTALGLMDELNPAAVDLLKSYAGGEGEGLYALPLEMNIEGFWYNKSIFRKYGLQEPQTWEEMLKIAAFLHRNGVQPYSVAGKEKWPITRLINAYAIRMYGADVMDRVDRGDITLTSPGFVEAAATVQDMGLRGYYGTRVNEVDMAASVNLFLQGKAAMFYMGSWQLRAFNDDNQNKIGADNIGFFSIPLVKGGSGSLDEYPVNAGLTTSFSKAAYTPEVSGWMAYVFEHYGDRAMDDLGMVTGFNVAAMPEDVSPLTKMVQEKINGVKRGALWFEAKFDTGAQLMAWDNAQLLVTRQDYTPLDYLTALQQEIDQER